MNAGANLGSSVVGLLDYCGEFARQCKRTNKHRSLREVGHARNKKNRPAAKSRKMARPKNHKAGLVCPAFFPVELVRATWFVAQPQDLVYFALGSPSRCSEASGSKPSVFFSKSINRCYAGGTQPVRREILTSPLPDSPVRAAGPAERIRPFQPGRPHPKPQPAKPRTPAPSETLAGARPPPENPSCRSAASRSVAPLVLSP